MSRAAIQGSYADLRFVKGRKVAQITIEIPIEMGDEFVRMFGAPNPAAEIPVALARLEPAPKQDAETKPARRMQDLPPAQQAALCCNDPVFQAFAIENMGAGEKSVDGAADAVRSWCRVDSRAALTTSPRAAEEWRKIHDRFLAWRRAA